MSSSETTPPTAPKAISHSRGGGLSRIYAVGLNTFREAIRDRVLVGVLGFAIAILLFSLALGELSLNQQARVVYDITMASISLFSVVMAVFLGSSLLYKEIERKTLYVILPKPIRRHEFLVGKYLGIVMTIFVFILLMGGVQFLVSAVQAGVSPAGPLGLVLLLCIGLGVAAARLPDISQTLGVASFLFLAASALVAQQAGVELSLTLGQLTLILLEVVVLSSVALLFSSFSTPFLTGAFSVGVWLVGRSAHEMAHMQTHVLGEQTKDLLAGLAKIVPNFNLFVPGRQVLQEGVWSYVGQTAAYGLLYAALLLVVSSLVFRRRDFL